MSIDLDILILFGGFGLLPSGVYHQELPTTIPYRRVDAPRVLDIHARDAHGGR